MATVDTKQAEENQKKIETEIQPLEMFAKEIKIKTQADFLAVDSRVKLVKRLIGDSETIFEPTIKNYYEPYKFWLGIKNGLVGRLKTVETSCKRAMVAWSDEQERKQKEAEAKAAAEAAKKTEQKQAEINAKADAAEASGESEKADMLRQAAAETVVAPKEVASRVPDVQGTAFRDNWVGEVVDLKALIKAVSEGRAPIGFLMADASAINKQAKATKDTFKIDGVRFWNNRTVAVSSK